ncbi:MAG: tetratricopeptide repeat protein [Anaerolineales bacterium]|nr:tetratricopeptide repeat protein [Anaerolineales bacterium]
MRPLLRNTLILTLILLSILVPYIASGYSELRKAETARTHLEAAEHYQAAALRIPWRADLYELAGHHFYYAEEYVKADAAYQTALKRNALSPEGWVAWGDVTYLNGDLERGSEIWAQGIEQPNSSDKLYSRLAQTYQDRGEYSKAAEYLQLYVNVHTEDAPAQYRLGLLLTISNPNEALSHLSNASQLDPQFDSAFQILRTALNLSALSNSPSEQKVLIGRGLGLVQEWELARVAFEQAVQLDEKNAEAWAWLGEADQQTAKNDALTSLDRALSLDPNSAIVHGLRGLYFQRIGNHREALAEFQEAAKLDPENPSWYVSIGQEFAGLGDLIRAVQAYQVAIALKPDSAEYYLLLANFCAQSNANVRDVGIPAAQKAVQMEPTNPSALDTLGWLLTLDGRTYEAESLLQQALTLDPKLASAHYHLALLYLQANDFDAMRIHLVAARDLGSAEAEALLQQYFP